MRPNPGRGAPHGDPVLRVEGRYRGCANSRGVKGVFFLPLYASSFPLPHDSNGEIWRSPTDSTIVFDPLTPGPCGPQASTRNLAPRGRLKDPLGYRAMHARL
jgi:hypothetical protein